MPVPSKNISHDWHMKRRTYMSGTIKKVFIIVGTLLACLILYFAIFGIGGKGGFFQKAFGAASGKINQSFDTIGLGSDIVSTDDIIQGNNLGNVLNAGTT